MTIPTIIRCVVAEAPNQNDYFALGSRWPYEALLRLWLWTRSFVGRRLLCPVRAQMPHIPIAVKNKQCTSRYLVLQLQQQTLAAAGGRGRSSRQTTLYVCYNRSAHAGVPAHLSRSVNLGQPEGERPLGLYTLRAPAAGRPSRKRILRRIGTAAISLGRS